MKCSRHGRRPLILAATLAFLGCGGPASAPKTPAIAPPATVHMSSLCLTGPAVPVVQIVWGGRSAPGQVAIRFADGRFAIHRVERGEARLLSTGPANSTVCALAIVASDRVATGGSTGLEVWDTSQNPAKQVAANGCGRVTSLAAETLGHRRTILIAGFADGRARRFDGLGDDRLSESSRPIVVRENVAVVGLEPTPSGGLVALASDGTAWTIPENAASMPEPIGLARSLAHSASSRLVARLVDGPRVDVTSIRESSSSGRFHPPDEVSTIALVDDGRTLAVGGLGRLWLVPIEPGTTIRPSEARTVGGYRGGVIVGAGPDGSSLAVGDGSGRVEILDASDLRRLGEPISLDDAPEWAFQPWLRLGRPRDRERTSPGRGGAKAEAAEAVGRGGESSSAVLEILTDAASTFAREGATDRQADMEFWRGMLLARRFDPPKGDRDARSSPEAIGTLRRAGMLYRRSGLARQAALADVALAWVALDLDDARGAIDAFASASAATSIDPVLLRVPEIDRVSAAMAVASGHWPRAAEADARVLDRLAPGEKPGLRRDSSLEMASILGSRGAWADAAKVLDADDRSDAEWTIRRAVCRRLAGLPDSAFADDDPIHAHARGIRAASGPDPAVALADLKRAAASHRTSGRGDLAIEADLTRAEVLERSGRRAEAGPIYAAVEREARSLGPDPIRRASRPVLELAARAARGLARSEIAANRPGHAFAALDRAMSPSSEFEPGGLLGLPASEFPKAALLREARDRLTALGGPGASPDADAAQAQVHRLRAELAGRSRAARPRDDPAGPDPKALGLADDESILIVAEAGPETIAGILFRGRSEPVAKILPIGQTDLDRSIATWRTALGAGGRPMGSLRAPSAAAILGPAAEPNLASSATAPGRVEARLYDAIVAPFETQLGGVRRLFVVPGAGLSALPLEAIGRGARLGDQFSIRELSSAMDLPKLRDEARVGRPPGLQALAVAPASLAALRAGKFLAVELDRGSPPLSKWSAFAVLHLNEQATARDLAVTPLCARLLVVEMTEPSSVSIEGWARAGLQAGADSILIAIWPHPEESSRVFFHAFYRELGTGQEPAEALAKARSIVARDPRFRDPVHWAGYSLFGL